MKRLHKILITALLTGIFITLSTLFLSAQFKWTSDYKNLYNEKVAVDLELKSVKRQYANEKSRLEKKINNLESQIDVLNKKIQLCEDTRKKDNELSAKRIKELEKTISIMKKRGSNREKELIAENEKLEARYKEELRKLREKLRNEKKANIDLLAKTKKDYEDKISELQKQITQLNDTISNLKKLTKSQKDELERLERQANELEKQLKEEIEKGNIRLKRMHGKLIINIDDRISFDSGSAKLKKAILPALKKITNILAEYPENSIVVEGHTDNVPIHTSKFRDNWQLSTERALSVLRYILKNKKLDRSRFAAAGYGEYNPLMPNTSAANKALNRRVDIVVVPRISRK